MDIRWRIFWSTFLLTSMTVLSLGYLLLERTGDYLFKQIKKNSAKGKATVIGSKMKVPSQFAALANGVGIHSDDYDDTQLAVGSDRVYGLLTHPTAPCLPSAFAEGEINNISGKDFLNAYNWTPFVIMSLPKANIKNCSSVKP